MYSKPVLAVYAVAFLSMYVISAIEWTLLPFLRHVSPTGVVSSAHYIVLAAIPQLVPIVSNPLLGWLASQCGTAAVLGTSMVVVGVGVALMIVCWHNPTLVTAGLCIYSMLTGMRVLRIAVLSDLVAPSERTAVLAWHFSMAPLGALTAPLAWVVLQHGMGDASWTMGPIVVDRFTVNHGIAAIFMVSSGVLIFLFRHSLEEPPLPAAAVADLSTSSKDVERQALSSSSSYGAVDKEEEPQDETTKTNQESIVQASTKSSSSSSLSSSEPRKTSLPLWACFTLFTSLQLSVRIVYAATWGTFQPTLMHRFGFSEKGVANAYLVLSVMALIPPVAIAYMSSRMTDRHIMLFGVALKLVGAAMYLPIFGTVTAIPVVIGFVLVTKASSFFTTALLSLFSKAVPDGRTRAAMFGYLWSIATGLPAILQVVFAQQFYDLLGTWYFAIFFAPAILAALIVAHPRFENVAVQHS